MGNDCWQILGLDPLSATEREVKSAYAKLIKTRRPDADPEGFQQAREAFDTALLELQRRVADAAVPSSEPVVPDHLSETIHAPKPAVPSLLAEAEQKIIDERDADNLEAMGERMASLLSVCHQASSGAEVTALWRESLHRVTGGRADLLARGVGTSQLIAEMESGSAVICHALISWWEQEHDIASLISLGEALLAESARLRNPDAGVVALRVAILIGFAQHELVSPLIDFAFPIVDTRARAELITQAEQQAVIGRLMPALRKDQAEFWHRRVLRPRAEWDWTSKEAEDALHYLAEWRDGQWEGYRIIRQIAPEDWFQRLDVEVGRRQRAQSTTMSSSSQARDAQPASSWKPSGKWPIWIILVVLSNLARLISTSYNSNDSTSHARPSSYPPPYRPAPTNPSSAQPSSPVFGRTTSDTLPIDPDSMLRKLKGELDASTGLLPPPSSSPRTSSNNPFSLLSPDIVGTGNPRPSPLPTPKTQPRSPSDELLAENLNLIKSRERADRIRALDKEIPTWINAINALGSEAQQGRSFRTPEEGKVRSIDYRKKMLGVLRQLHSLGGRNGHEHRCLEVLLFDSATSALELEATMMHQADVEMVDLFLPLWEEAAELRARDRYVFRFISKLCLDNLGTRLGSDERTRLETLAAKK